MSSHLPYPIRGTEAWDERELRRLAEGKKCISFGAIPPGFAAGEPRYLELGNQYGPNWEKTDRKSAA